MTNFSVLSWNIQGQMNYTGYTFFKKIRPHLVNGSADIIALQELSDPKKLLESEGVINTYHAFFPKKPNYNALLSKFPIIRAEELIFPKRKESQALENCIRADLQVDDQLLRIYNCHFGIFRAGIATRLNQLKYVLDDASSFTGPIIVCGDLNVTIPRVGFKRNIIRAWHQEPFSEMFVDGKLYPGDERDQFNEIVNQYGFKEVFDLYGPTWSPFKSKLWEIFGLKLDWFMVKRIGVTAARLNPYVSDHRGLNVSCSINGFSR